MVKGSKRIFYGESLKRQVVRDYATGRYTYSRLVEIYNNQRPHMSCHLLTSNQRHNQQKLKAVTWRKKMADKTVNKE